MKDSRIQVMQDLINLERGESDETRALLFTPVHAAHVKHEEYSNEAQVWGIERRVQFNLQPVVLGHLFISKVFGEYVLNSRPGTCWTAAELQELHRFISKIKG